MKLSRRTLGSPTYCRICMSSPFLPASRRGPGPSGLACTPIIRVQKPVHHHVSAHSSIRPPSALDTCLKGGVKLDEGPTVEVLDPLQCPVLDEQRGEEHVEAVGLPDHQPRGARAFTPTGKDRRRANGRGVSLLPTPSLSVICVW